MEEMGNVYRSLIRKHEGRRQLGRPRRKWDGDIRMDLREIVLELVGWIHLAQGSGQWWAAVNTAMNLLVP
jgi:hypothetical protein